MCELVKKRPHLVTYSNARAFSGQVLRLRYIILGNINS